MEHVYRVIDHWLAGASILCAPDMLPPSWQHPAVSARGSHYTTPRSMTLIKPEAMAHAAQQLNCTLGFH